MDTETLLVLIFGFQLVFYLIEVWIRYKELKEYEKDVRSRHKSAC